MGFFERHRAELAERGIDPERLPPGQFSTDRFPVLHVGTTPRYGDLSTWDLRVFGAAATPVTLTWSDVLALPQVDVTTDIHCVTKWSKFDTTWRGVPFADVLALAGPDPAASHVMLHGEHGYTTNLPLADCLPPHVALLAHTFDGAPLEPDHGYPLRMVVPHLYFWKSCKWLRGVELLTADRPGFWEQNGYHMYGDPFREERYTDD